MKNNNLPRFTVVMQSAGGCERDLFHYDTFAGAMVFCQEHQWSFKDENGFVWDLEIRDNHKAE